MLAAGSRDIRLPVVLWLPLIVSCASQCGGSDCLWLSAVQSTKAAGADQPITTWSS